MIAIRRAPIEDRCGFTIVEMLVAVALTLLLMTMVVSVMSQVMESVTASRSSIEMNDRLRYTRERLQNDLAGITLFPNPPHRPENGEGYFEYIEGPMGPTAPFTGTLVDGVYVLSSMDEVESNPGAFPNFDFTGAANPGEPVDRTVGDLDDIIMFTTRSQGEPFVGRYLDSVSGNIVMVESQVAEVAYFVRGTTLYRRVLLVRPDLPLNHITTNFYANNDISARQVEGPAPFNIYPPLTATPRLVANSLGDLTKRENRYGHQPFRWPHDARFWGALGLPTLQECSDPNWPFPYFLNGSPSGSTADGDPASFTADPAGRPFIVPDGVVDPNPQVGRLVLTRNAVFDAWRNDAQRNRYPYTEVDRDTGVLTAYADGTRVAEDVLLTNVLSFDVKVWDPGAPLAASVVNGPVHQPGDALYLQAVFSGSVVGYGAFVDLWGFRELDTNNDGIIQTGTEYPLAAGAPEPVFLYRGNPASDMVGSRRATAPAELPYLASVYDTWSTHYEQDGINQDMFDPYGIKDAWRRDYTDQGTDGIDNDGQNGVDDPGEMESPPPYPYPLRAIQVKIRVFEPDTRQIRETTVVHEFLPQ